MQPNTIGEKVRFFRSRADLSQFDLETALKAAPGSISRLEHDKVNPTKETLHEISAILKLTSHEKGQLFDLYTVLPSPAEVEDAISEVQDYFMRDDVMAYLLDEWANFYVASKGIVQLLGLDEHLVSFLKGKSLIEICFDPQYGIRGLIDPQHFKEIFKVEIARTRAEVDLDNQMSQLIKRLMKLPDFSEVWDSTEETELERVISSGSKIVYFNLNGQKIRLNFAREKLKRNPRFEIIEFFNPMPY